MSLTHYVQNSHCFTACAFGTTLPFPGRPNLFYLYDGRKTMTPMKCPRGTWYRPDICTCDWIIPGKVEKEGTRFLTIMMISKGPYICIILEG